MSRALRVDKLTLAGLAATLRLYVQPDAAEPKIPILALLATRPENLKHRAERIAAQLAGAPLVAEAQVIESSTYLGGGAIPSQQLATFCVALVPRQVNAQQLATRLRLASPAVFSRIQQDQVLLDLRAVAPGEDRHLVEAIRALGPPSEDAQPDHRSAAAESESE